MNLSDIAAALAAAAREPYLPPAVALPGARPLPEEIVDPLGRAALALLPRLFRHEDPVAAAKVILDLDLGEREVGRIAEALATSDRHEGLRGPEGDVGPGAAAVLRCLDRPGVEGPGYEALRRALDEIGLRSLEERGLPSLPSRLPRDLEGLRALAALLGASLDERSAPEPAARAMLLRWADEHRARALPQVRALLEAPVEVEGAAPSEAGARGAGARKGGAARKRAGRKAAGKAARKPARKRAGRVAAAPAKEPKGKPAKKKRPAGRRPRRGR